MNIKIKEEKLENRFFNVTCFGASVILLLLIMGITSFGVAAVSAPDSNFSDNEITVADKLTKGGIYFSQVSFGLIFLTIAPLSLAYVLVFVVTEIEDILFE